jgi:hypothetical protein
MTIGKTWKAEIDLPFSVTTFEYKFVVLNNNTRAVVWEQGNNKVWSGIDKVVVAEHWEEDKTAMRNLGKMDLVVALSALRKVRLANDGRVYYAIIHVFYSTLIVPCRYN